MQLEMIIIIKLFGDDKVFNTALIVIIFHTLSHRPFAQNYLNERKEFIEDVDRT